MALRWIAMGPVRRGFGRAVAQDGRPAVLRRVRAVVLVALRTAPWRRRAASPQVTFSPTGQKTQAVPPLGVGSEVEQTHLVPVCCEPVSLKPPARPASTSCPPPVRSSSRKLAHPLDLGRDLGVGAHTGGRLLLALLRSCGSAHHRLRPLSGPARVRGASGVADGPVGDVGGRSAAGDRSRLELRLGARAPDADGPGAAGDAGTGARGSAWSDQLDDVAPHRTVRAAGVDGGDDPLRAPRRCPGDGFWTRGPCELPTKRPGDDRRAPGRCGGRQAVGIGLLRGVVGAHAPCSRGGGACRGCRHHGGLAALPAGRSRNAVPDALHHRQR